MIVRRSNQCRASGPNGVKCQRRKGHDGKHMASKSGSSQVKEW